MTLSAVDLSLAQFHEVLRLNLGHGGYGVEYECAADPRVRVRIQRYLPDAPARVTLLVEEQAFPRGDWTAAAAALAALPQAPP